MQNMNNIDRKTKQSLWVAEWKEGKMITSPYKQLSEGAKRINRQFRHVCRLEFIREREAENTISNWITDYIFRNPKKMISKKGIAFCV